MQIILLSGGSGTRLWPLSNDVRSKQFLKLLPIKGSKKRESMVQRVVRQINESRIDADINIATSLKQQDSIISQLGDKVNIITEPSRRDTMPAISLASEYLSKMKGCSREEVIIVMPCDSYTDLGYFDAIHRMADCINNDVADLVLMGIKPSYPSSKYGYILPDDNIMNREAYYVKQFVEKPEKKVAEKLVKEGAFWNGGVFAFRLGYLLDISSQYVKYDSFDAIVNNYNNYPKISFDYEVVEKAKSVVMIEYSGEWSDLGTWDTLTEKIGLTTYGNVITDKFQENTHIVNELNIPLICIGTNNLIIAASPDGILVSDKHLSEDVKIYAEGLKRRPMYEERRWGWYKVIDYVEFDDGSNALTKRLKLNQGKKISYQRHLLREEVWTIIDGNGEVVIDGKRSNVSRGDTICIPCGCLHSIRAISSLTFIEVQSGTTLVESDIERFPYDW